MYYKHGDSKTKLYRLWKTMRSRCNDSSRPHFNRYGGRGIKVCEQWNEDYISFKKWATRKEQAQNRCDSLHFEINGEHLSSKDLYDRYHIHIQSLIAWRKKKIILKKLKERIGDDVKITGGKIRWEKE